MLTIKEQCKDYALKIKLETGKFPVAQDWKKSKGFPVSIYTLTKLFDGSYNNFRNYCNEPILSRREEISLEWIKSNCTIDNNDCWNWNKAKHPISMYGHLGFDGRSWYTHRLTFTLVKGEIPNNLLIRHKCDNKSCCNPDHLELGTQKDNSLDVSIRNSEYIAINNNKLAWQIRKYKTLNDRANYYLNNSISIENNCKILQILKTNKQGYYNISFNNTSYILHRVLLSIKLNKPYEELNITRHTCNNKNCINPDHLEEGSSRDNSLDAESYSKSFKLSRIDVITIKNSMKDHDFTFPGEKTKFDLLWSSKFKVNKNTIADIRRGNTWRHVLGVQ